MLQIKLLLKMKLKDKLKDKFGEDSEVLLARKLIKFPHETFANKHKLAKLFTNYYFERF
jgi:hypothetical protein